jgi:hypothetical protein
MKHYCLSSINLWMLLGIRKNCLISERGPVLYQFTKRAIKLTVVIIMGYYCYQLQTKLYQYSPLKVKSIHIKLLAVITKGFDVTDQLLIRFLYPSDTGKKIGVLWDSTSDIHRFQESLRFSEEGSIVQYSLRVWGTHEASQGRLKCVYKNV